MSSINTNLGAMVALDTLKGINKNLGMVQNEISTGKSINSAADNAAIWSISTVMESDVAGFEQISNSLNLGSATVGVARTAAEEVVTNLQDIRDNIIAAQENNVDKDKIQIDINESIAQIESIVAGAQFNGQNLLNSSGSINILSSLNRDAAGNVNAGQISVDKQNLTTNAGTTSALVGGITAAGASVAANTTADAYTFATGVAVTEGNIYTVAVGGETVAVTAGASDDHDSLANKLVSAINGAGVANVTAQISGTGDNVVELVNGNAGVVTTTITSQTSVNVAGGALAGLNGINVGSTGNAAMALNDIENILGNAIDAAAQFGSKQKRIDNQIGFVSSLGDSLKAGISTLTDANLEEASARLQALQVQQQLGVQALSIANQAPQALLSLFR